MYKQRFRIIPANFGGTLGVCIGASLLTICEFIQFGVIIFIKVCKRWRKLNGQAVTHMSDKTELCTFKPADPENELLSCKK